VRRNNRIAGRIWAAVALAMLLAWGIPAVAPAALADSAVASAATPITQPQVQTQPHVRPDDAASCVQVLELAGYTINTKMNTGCLAGAASYPGPPHIALAIAFAVCGGLLLWGGVDHATTTLACGAANAMGIIMSSTQWCGPNSGNDCLNAWNGGPWVGVRTIGPETSDTNQEFMVIDENGNQNDSEIMFTGSGSWSGECIGDAYNNSSDGDVSLDPCALPGQSAGWGTQMTWGTSGCPSGEAWFKDNHWNGYLGPPAGAVNGSHWDLNVSSPVCFAVIIDP
jgi:hypothetical protein